MKDFHVCPPDNGPLQLRLGEVHDVLQDPPQWDWDGQKDEHAGYEPGFTVSANLQTIYLLAFNKHISTVSFWHIFLLDLY